MFVRIARLGERVQEVYISDGATVSEALDAADMDYEGFNISVGGSPASLDTTLTEGAVVTLTPEVKGG